MDAEVTDDGIPTERPIGQWELRAKTKPRRRLRRRMALLIFTALVFAFDAIGHTSVVHFNKDDQHGLSFAAAVTFFAVLVMLCFGDND